MIKSSRIMKIFERYVKKYDMNNINIKTRYFHSLKVMELSHDIAASTGLFNEEEILVCEIIGLFHEIANFNATPNFHLEDDEVEDYALKSAKMLFETDLMRDITKETKYDEIIKIAIFAYNKTGFPDGIDEKTKAFIKVIRDAHQIDQFRVVLNYPYIDTRIVKYPTSMVYDRFKTFQVVPKKLSENNSDDVIIVLSSIFAINYPYSFYVLKGNNYINEIVDLLSFNDDSVATFFKQIKLVINKYIDRKIGVSNVR